MRNLKKFLALVMAMVMAFSLMVSANAAWVPVDGTTGTKYNDVNDVTPAFEEAVDVLTGMKVYQGDAEAPTFRPGSNITRAEVAALIYRLATGDTGTEKMQLYTTQHPFTDVRADAWYAGYVGYCWNAGYIKGTTATTFNPSDNVTGYEVLAMILRAVGYDKNGEFTGTTWRVNVSALATNLGILNDVKTTHYANTLNEDSRRDVVASLLFRTAAYVPMVIYTTAFGYQQTGMGTGTQVGTPATIGTALNPTLGLQNFGLTLSDDGVVVGNKQTGASATIMGYAGSVTLPRNEVITDTVTGTTQVPDPANPGQFITADVTYNVQTNTQGEQYIDWSAYAYAGVVTAAAPVGTFSVGDNRSYELETGIDLFGHNLKLWFDNRPGNNNHVYAYYDEATLVDVVKADGTNVTLPAAAANAGFAATGSAVFSNSFSRFGSDFTTNVAQVGNGVPTSTAEGRATPLHSPVNLYLLISNSSNKALDVVIPLNIESSQITESNEVNRVATLGMPVTNAGTSDANWQWDTEFIDGPAGSENVKTVNGVATGVIAQNALVGNSTKALGDYEMGIHITGTTPRTVSANETAAINGTGAENARYLLAKVTATVEGTVVAYNNVEGTVTLQNGTVLNRSKFYETVVGWSDTTSNSSAAPTSVIPQGWVQGASGYWEEGYANVGYKFYTDFDGNYLGAERSYGSSFLYGTYLDYDQKTSTSTFNYYLTGVNLNGEVETKQVTSFWSDNGGTPARYSINGTNELRVPFRATNSAATLYAVNGLGFGQYIGFAFTGTVADGLVGDPSAGPGGDLRGEYLNNMRRLGVYQGAETNPDGNATLDSNTTIDNTAATLGAKEVNGTGIAGNTNRYFTEATKFILVSGFGTDSVKATVYNGISDLKGNATSVILRLGETMGPASLTPGIAVNGIVDAVDNTVVPVAEMTYYTESNYTYAQSGQTAKKVDTIILPADAVTWTGGSGLYYVGNPTASLTNSWGIDAWKYTMYVDGEAQQVWLTNQPGNNAGSSAETHLEKDSFYHLVATGYTANDGQPIYTAGNYDSAGSWTSGVKLTDAYETGPINYRPTEGFMDNQIYSAVTRDAQTATFSGDGSNSILLRVAGANVVNLNKDAKVTGTVADSEKNLSGEIWPGIDSLQTLNQAGSIDPVTGRNLKVACVMDPSNNLIVKTIYVCWDQFDPAAGT